MSLRIIAVFDVHIDSPGNIRTHNATDLPRGLQSFAGYGWAMDQDPIYSFERGFTHRPVLILDDNQVYVNYDIANTLGGRSFGREWEVEIGRARYYRLDSHIVDWIEQNSYERRNDRERRVQLRNDDLMNFLMGLQEQVTKGEFSNEADV